MTSVLVGYLVCCPRIPAGRYCGTIEDAIAEMNRQMRAGATDSGISEVWQDAIEVMNNVQCRA